MEKDFNNKKQEDINFGLDKQQRIKKKKYKWFFFSFYSYPCYCWILLCN